MGRSLRLPIRLGLAAAVLAASTLGAADPTPPKSPKVQAVSPTGAIRGSAVNVVLSGENLGDSIALGATFSASGTTATNGAPGKDSSKSRWTLTVPAEVSIGWHQLRLLTQSGLSNARPFCIDALPQIQAGEGARTKETAQGVPVPCVVSGRVVAEAATFLRFAVAAGQRLSFEVLGRRLGSALDPWIKLYDARSGRELPHAYCDDAPGLQTDSRLTYTFAAAGEYLIEVRDSMWRGGNDFNYRLRIGDFPCAIAPLPLAAPRGRKVTVAFAGPTVDGVAPVEITTPADAGVEAVPVTPVGTSGLPGWPVTLALSEFDELLALEPTPPGGLPLPVPGGVTGRFARKAQVDRFRIAARKGQKYIVAAQSTEFMSPAEVYLELRNAAGSVFARSSPEKGPRVEFSAEADGDVVISAEHGNYAFGPNEVYRLTVAQPKPGFDITLAADRVSMAQSQAGLIAIQSLVRRDYQGPIELSIVGKPGISGTLTVSAGAASGPPPGPGQPASAPFAMLPVRAAADLAPGVYDVRVQAKAVVDGKEVVAFASTAALVSQAMGGLPFPPRTWLRSVAVGVLPRPPFQLSARFELPEAVRGLTTTLIVEAKRDDAFDGPIEISASGLPPNVTATGLTLAAGQSEGRLTLKLGESTAFGAYAFTLAGRTTLGHAVNIATIVAPPLVVALPFELRAEPNPLAIGQGEKVGLKVSATRKGGYDGPIELELRNLPAQVTAGKSRIEQGQTSAVVDLVATPSAPLGARGDVDVLGTTALAAQQASSPPFVVKVQAPMPSLALKIEPAGVTLKPGARSRIKVTVERKNVGGPVQLSVSGLPAKVTAADVTVPADQNGAEIELVASAADTVPATSEATITGKVGATTGAAKITVRVEKLMDR